MRPLFAVVILLLSACQSAPAPTPAPRVAPDEVLVVLQRTPCFGRCPAYTVTVHADGRVDFVGQSSVAVTEPVHDQLDAATVRALVERFEGSAFATWKSEYVDAHVTDLPSTTLTFRGKSIHRYGDQAPPELVPLEDAVDALVGTARWVSGKGAPAL